MRKELARREEYRGRFSGTFVRVGSKTGYKGRIEQTVLLSDIRDEGGKIVAGHLWFNYTKGFRGLGELVAGDVVMFDARVKLYIKGYVNRREYVDEREVDYKLSHPTRFVVKRCSLHCCINAIARK